MKLKQWNKTRKGAAVLLAVLGGSLVVGASPAGQQPQGRKSTDPPMASRGKMAQELFLAIDHRDTATVKALLKQGADPNSRNGLTFTPLYLASASHQPEVMNALLEAGADPNADSTYGTPLTFAAVGGNALGAKVLMGKGVDVNVTRFDGMTVLMMASSTGAPEIVSELLARKADVKAANESGATALMIAARNGNAKVADLLIEAGSDVNVTDKEQQTPLMAAAMNGRPEIVQALLKSGANVNARDAKGRTAVILAASYGDYPEVIKALKKGGADLNVKDSSGRNAAAIAVARGRTNSAPLLGKASSGKAVREPRQAVRASLEIIQSSMVKFNQMTACISCHQEGLARITTGKARDKGFLLNPEVIKLQAERINGALNALRPLHEGALKSPEVMKQVPLIEINEVTPGYTWMLAGMMAHNEPVDAARSSMAMVLGRQQSPDGFWSFSVPRVPMQSSFFTFTALAAKALKTYGPAESSDEVKDRIQRANKWLAAAEAKNSEDRAFRLLGLKWTGGNGKDLQTSIAAIRADQHPDGGWGQMPGMPSDAYATGQALYALHEAGGMPVTDPVYQRGVQYLLRTQDEDGSWFVNKRALPLNNYFDAGFPHGESQYASFNGTCWATLALLETVNPKR